MTDNLVPAIAVDAMGGDHGPQVVVPGAIDAGRRTGAKILLVGREQDITPEIQKIDVSGVDIEVVHADQVVDMDEKPSEVLRRKKDSSILKACRLVAEGRAHGVVSAGNSGATMAAGMFTLGRVNGVERPALASVMPTEKKPMVLLDVGANVDCKPHHLFQFGLMANVLAKDVLNIAKPRVGLLSIGEEEGKGNSQVKETFELFKMSQMNFIGNIEGRDLFVGDLDVIVCDGFVGNVALKLSEGLGTSLARLLKRELDRGILSRIGTMLAMGALKRFARLADYAEYGGAPLLGLKGIAIIGHGRSNAKAVCKAVDVAATYVRKRTNEHLVRELLANEELIRYGRASH